MNKAGFPKYARIRTFDGSTGGLTFCIIIRDKLNHIFRMNLFNNLTYQIIDVDSLLPFTLLVNKFYEDKIFFVITITIMRGLL